MSSSVKAIVENPELVRERRRQLVAAAITLFNRQGYFSTTVKDIAKEAGFSAGLIYQYVLDKQDVLFLALQQIVETNKEQIPAALRGLTDPLRRLVSAIEAYCRVLDANRDAVLLTYRETKSLKPEHKETLKRSELETNEMLSSCIEECIEHGYLQPAKVELLTYHIVVVAHAWALKYWRLREITTLDEYIRLNVHSAWQAFLTPRGRRHCSKVLKSGASVADGGRSPVRAVRQRN